MSKPARPETTPPNRRTVLKAGAFGAGGMVTGPLLLARPGWAATRPSGVHLAFGADPRHEVAVSWSTSQSVSGAVLDLGLDTSYGLTLPADSGGAPQVGTVYHHVRAADLMPGRTYHYRLRHHGADPVTGTFRTAPAAREAFTFAALGDMGVSDAAATNVARLRAADPAFAFMVGDLCYADNAGGTDLPLDQDPTRWDSWLGQIQPSAAGVPWMTTVGNHEMERNNGELGYDGYLARFALPGNGVRGGVVTYSFQYGNVGFIALDGNDASYEIPRNKGYLGADQDRWLTRTLATMRRTPGIDFIVVGFHNCMYCTNPTHASDGGHRARWQRILDDFSVDLVLSGHNHSYERTHPLRDGEPVTEAPAGATVNSADGTTYLTVGGGGASGPTAGPRPLSYVVGPDGTRIPEYADWSAYAYLNRSVALIDVTPRDGDGTATMTIRAQNLDGMRIDKVTLRRRRR